MNKKTEKLIWIFLFLRVSNDRTNEREAKSHRHRRQVRIHRLHRVPSPLHFTTHIKTQSHIRNAPSTWESWIESFCAVDTWGSQSWERYERERGRIAVLNFVIAASQANDLNDCPSPSPSPYVSHTQPNTFVSIVFRVQPIPLCRTNDVMWPQMRGEIRNSLKVTSAHTLRANTVFTQNFWVAWVTCPRNSTYFRQLHLPDINRMRHSNTQRL